MARFFILLTTFLLGISLISSAQAFYGFYVGKDDKPLFNKSSQVVYVRDGDRNIITMVNNYKGEAKDFALVVPVPTLLKKDEIRIINNATIQRLDDYSAPRLVEYHDSDPCQPSETTYELSITPPAPVVNKAEQLGVEIEAKYTVGEYDILLLSAQESKNLVTFLKSEGYQLPAGAERVISRYIKQDMKFFIAKINLTVFVETGYTKLRPIQIAYDSKRFILPIRLGTLNAKGEQELFVYALARKGQVKITNYRTIKLPTNRELPSYIKKKKLFGKFYKDMFNTQAKKYNKVAFLEYAWNMSHCDLCGAKPLTNKELKELGVFWKDDPVYLSRLHLRYDKKKFPEDLMFQITADHSTFQGSYALHHAFTGAAQCIAGNKYFHKELPKRFKEEIKTLAELTNWKIKDIRKQQGIPKHNTYQTDDWIERIWD
ncbi:MAG: DUF2330 domain-containing protein [Thiotrichaceae bacterium]|nr:DUF2330 domain-containing protein [Thiotrichaceae bacterium]